MLDFIYFILISIKIIKIIKKLIDPLIIKSNIIIKLKKKL